MQRGDVLFFAAGDSAVDRAIVGSSLSRYVHVGIALDDVYYVEAVWPRVRVSTIRSAAPTLTARPPYTDDAQAERATNAAILTIGQQYDAVGVAAFGAGLVFPNWRDAISSTIKDADVVLKLHALWCSQLVAHSLIVAGLSLPFSEYCSPGEMAKYLGLPDSNV